MNSSKFYITTPIYYANGDPHIGHAYTTISADVLARFNRMMGSDVFFLTGTDEHGEKIQEAATKNNLEVKEFVDKYAAKFELTWDSLNISNNHFIRTTSDAHKKAVQIALQRLYDKGLIYKGSHKGLYCIGCEQYKTEKDLVNGMCSDHQREPVEMEEECYMFKLSEFGDILKKKIESDEVMIRPEDKKNEVLSFIIEGLRDISFSRKTKWGVELPWDSEHTTYVWPDAFLNYITGLGWDGGDDVPSMWPAQVQLMSKDIARVHATIWLAILTGLELPLPEELFVHGFFLVDGAKMSKSVGNVITPEDLVNKYGADATRYLLTSATPFGHDGDIGFEKFNEKYNADLANGIGNLVSRSVTLGVKAREVGICLQKSNSASDEWGGVKFEHAIGSVWENYTKSMKELKIDIGVKIIQEQVKFLDNYITIIKPWELISSKDQNVGFVLYNIIERIRHIGMMLIPFMPETAEKIITSIGLDFSLETKRSFEEFTQWGYIEENTSLVKGEGLFPRL